MAHEGGPLWKNPTIIAAAPGVVSTITTNVAAIISAPRLTRFNTNLGGQSTSQQLLDTTNISLSS